MLLYTFLLICLDWYKEYTISLISFNKLSELVPAFTYARAIGNLWSICLGVNILSPFPLVSFCFDSERASGLIFALSFNKSIIFCLELLRFLMFSIAYNCFSLLYFGFPDSISFKSFLKSFCSSSICCNVVLPFFYWSSVYIGPPNFEKVIEEVGSLKL